MANLIFEGQVTTIGETITGVSQAGKQWQKTSFVVTEPNGENQYPQSCKFDTFKPISFRVGDTVSVKFSIQANTIKDGRVFNNISAFDVFVKGATYQQAPQQRQQQQQQMPYIVGQADDSLPF